MAGAGISEVKEVVTMAGEMVSVAGEVVSVAVEVVSGAGANNGSLRYHRLDNT